MARHEAVLVAGVPKRLASHAEVLRFHEGKEGMFDLSREMLLLDLGFRKK